VTAYNVLSDPDKVGVCSSHHATTRYARSAARRHRQRMVTVTAAVTSYDCLMLEAMAASSAQI
jgi:hypothetical protein